MLANAVDNKSGIDAQGLAVQNSSKLLKRWCVQFRDPAMEVLFQNYFRRKYGNHVRRVIIVVCVFLIVVHHVQHWSYTDSIAFNIVFTANIAYWVWLLVMALYAFEKIQSRMQMVVLLLAELGVLYIVSSQYLLSFTWQSEYEWSNKVIRSLVVQKQGQDLSIKWYMMVSVLTTQMKLQYCWIMIIGVQCVLIQFGFWYHHFEVMAGTWNSFLYFAIFINVLGLSWRMYESNMRIKLVRCQELRDENSKLTKLNQSMQDALSKKNASMFESGITNVLDTLTNMLLEPSIVVSEKAKLREIICTLAAAEDLFEGDHGKIHYDTKTEGWLKVLQSSYDNKNRCIKTSNLRRTRSGLQLTPHGSIVECFHTTSISTKKSTTSLTQQLMAKIAKAQHIDVFEMSEFCTSPFTAVTLGCMSTESLLLALPIPVDTLTRFIHRIEKMYHSKNPYHNALHATAVVLDVHYYLKNVEQEISDLQYFSAIIAAAVHDVNHPGLTNGFLINSTSPLANTYSDDSILERMHLAETFRLVHEVDGHNIFKELPPTQAKESRRLIISMVLATDLAEHVHHINALKSKSYLNGEKTGCLESTMVLETFLLMADIGICFVNVVLFAQ